MALEQRSNSELSLDKLPNNDQEITHCNIIVPKKEEQNITIKNHVQRNKKKCYECRKKVGFTGFKCRCGFIFCGKHRHGDQHNCSFDYSSLAMNTDGLGGGVFAKLQYKL